MEFEHIDPENQRSFDFEDTNKLALLEVDFEKECSTLEYRVNNGLVDIIEVGRMINKALNSIESFKKRISDELYDNLDDKYSKAELAEMGIQLRSVARVETESLDEDDQHYYLKTRLKERADLMKKAYKMAKDGKELTVAGEVIPPCRYGKASKSVIFKR